MKDPRLLESWKDIAEYLGRSVRACARWEAELGLPVHRLDGSPKARVFAYRDEIDRWLEEKLRAGEIPKDPVNEGIGHAGQGEDADPGASEAARPAAAGRRLSWKTFPIFLSVLSLVAVLWLWLGHGNRIGTNPPMPVVPLITYPGEVFQPTFSPDGNEIAFVWNGKNRDNYDIYRKLIGPGEPLRLTTDSAPDRCPAWSRDGRFIAFLREGTSDSYTIYLIPALGGPERRLAECSLIDPLRTLEWSLDDKWLVICDGDAWGLELVSVDTGEKRRLTSPPAYSWDSNARFSPDGRALVFVRCRSLGIGDLYRVSLTEDLRPAAEPERLTYDKRYILSPIWTRDGKKILYSDGNWWSSGRTVRRLDLTTAKDRLGYPTFPEPFGEDATDVVVSPDGRRLVYTRSIDDTDIYRLAVSNKDGRVGAPEKFIASTRNEIEPAYAPDGKTIAFVSTRSGTQEIWLCSADGSNPRQLTSMGGPLTSGPNWAPDGETLVFDSRKEGSSDLFLISSHGGPAKRLTSEPGYEGYGTWSRDGNWIYFMSYRTGRYEVYRISSRGGNFVQITKDGGRVAYESPDGKWLYYSKDVTGGIALWKTPTDRGEETQIAGGPLDYYEEFKVIDDGILFRKVGGDLEFIDLKSGKTRTIAHMDKPWGLGLSVSPDRRWILITLLDQSFHDLMLVENFR